MRKHSIAVLAGLCLAAGSIIAAPAPQKPVTPQAGDGLQVAVDKQGKLRGLTPQEIAEFAAQFKPRPSVMRITTNAQGMTGMALDESTDHHFIARLNLDGTVSFVCTDDASDAIGFASEAAPTDTILRLRQFTPARAAAERE